MGKTLKLISVWADDTVPKDTPKENVQKEMLSYLVEKYPQLGVVKRFFATIKAWLHEKGIIGLGRLNDADLGRLALNALKGTAKGEVSGPLTGEGRGKGAMLAEIRERVKPAREAVRTFVEAVLGRKEHPNKITFQISTENKRSKVMQDIGIDIGESAEIIISDRVFHVRDGHPNMKISDWELLPEIAESFDQSYLGKQKGDPKTKRILFVRRDAPSNYVYVAEFASGDRGNRLNLTTFFKDTPNRVDQYLQDNAQKAKEAFSGAEDFTQPALRPQIRASDDSIPPSKPEVKTDNFGKEVLDRPGETVTLYHGSNSDDHASILKNGIRPNKKYGIGLAEPEQARLLAGSSASRATAKDQVVYKIEIPKSEITRLVKDHASNEHPDWRMYNADINGGNIKPGWIKEVKIGNGEWTKAGNNSNIQFSRASEAAKAITEQKDIKETSKFIRNFINLPNQIASAMRGPIKAMMGQRNMYVDSLHAAIRLAEKSGKTEYADFMKGARNLEQHFDRRGDADNIKFIEA